MSAFFIGQKVKKVRGDLNVGLVGIVVGLGGLIDQKHTLQVKADAPWLSQAGIVNPASVVGYWLPEHWEPIIPPGLESLEQINALWQTEPETVRA